MNNYSASAAKQEIIVPRGDQLDEYVPFDKVYCAVV